MLGTSAGNRPRHTAGARKRMHSLMTKHWGGAMPRVDAAPNPIKALLRQPTFLRTPLKLGGIFAKLAERRSELVDLNRNEANTHANRARTALCTREGESEHTLLDAHARAN